MTNAKPTQEPCKFVQGLNCYGIQRDDAPILGTIIYDDMHVAVVMSDADEPEANAELIVEAFNVLAETGMSPRQLADELKAAKQLLNLAGGLRGSCEQECADLTKQRVVLLAALKEAATSLETINVRSHGEESFLDSKEQMRAYAGSRATVARQVIAHIEGGAA